MNTMNSNGARNAYHQFFDRLDGAWKDYLAAFAFWALVGFWLPVKVSIWLDLGWFGLFIGVCWFLLVGYNVSVKIMERPTIGAYILTILLGFAFIVLFLFFSPLILLFVYVSRR